jgi:hypothetical protein
MRASLNGKGRSAKSSDDHPLILSLSLRFSARTSASSAVRKLRRFTAENNRGIAECADVTGYHSVRIIGAK